MSGLATGATLVLYDGSPFHPDAGVLWRMAQEERVTIFGTSAKYISRWRRARSYPPRKWTSVRCGLCCPPAHRCFPTVSTTSMSP